jgi:optic atrophy 3 protein
MRMRLGILHDPEAQKRMHEREEKAAEAKRKAAEVPTVRTEEEQRKYLEDQAKAAKEHAEGGAKESQVSKPKVKIRPLSEAKAIELGANFFSEAFIFAVAAGLLVWDSYRSRKKESQRRDDVAERLAELESEVDRLRSRYEPDILELKKRVPPPKENRWYNPVGWFRGSEPVEAEGEEDARRVAELEEAKFTLEQQKEAAAVPTPAPEKEGKGMDKKAKEAESKSGEQKAEAPPAPVKVEAVTAGRKER